jgi:hypothetical protein
VHRSLPGLARATAVNGDGVRAITMLSETVAIARRVGIAAGWPST